MSEIFITSDEHYGHANIIQFCDRPFVSTEQMQETIIERHNKKVPNNKHHLTIHAGDMFWQTMTEGEALAILTRLNGRHAFLYGNHDELMERSRLLPDAFEWVRGRNKENTSHSVQFNKHRIVISHFAQRVWQNSHKGSWHVYGHSHGEIAELGKSFDIGVDCHNFEPWSLEEIEAKMSKLSSHHVIPAAKRWHPCNPAESQYCGVCPDCLAHLRETGTSLMPRRGDGDPLPLGSLYEKPIMGHDGKTAIGTIVAYDPSIKNASVAQTVEQGTCNAKVGGSNPSAGSTVHFHPVGETCGFCAMQGRMDI
jgi:calcineurin-like phosphoesterase family protein